MLPSLVIVTVLSAMAAAESPAPLESLKTCLAEKTSVKDRKELGKWTFFALAAHPDMKAHMSAGAAEAADESSRTMAALVTRLLTETCVEETRAVVASGDAESSLQLAFGSLGELAMRELIGDKSVHAATLRFMSYLDQEHLTHVLSRK